MDVKLINPFLVAAVHVLKTMAHLDAKAGKPFLKKEQSAFGDVSAVIGITGEAQGSMALTFTHPCIKAVVVNLLGTELTEMDDEVNDAVGELTNMICGDARRRLAETGICLQAGIPTIVAGKGHTISHVADGPRLAVPFETAQGSFMVEVAFKGK